MSKLLIVEDSDLTRNEIKIIALSSGLFNETVTASTGEEGIKQVVKHKPDACVLDLEMPRMGGFTFLKWLMKNHPIPVLIFSSLNTNENIIKALELGAIDFLGKEKSYITSNFKEKFIEKLKILKNSKPRLLEINHKNLESYKIIPEKEKKYKFKLIVIGASTGGPTAIQRILKDIDGKISIPIIICQHMPKNFTPLFANRLNNLVQHYQVSEARHYDKIQENNIYICPGESHLLVSGKKIELMPSKSSDLYTPSIDITIQTAATYYRESLLGIILTGMGKDGLEGAKKLKSERGTLIIESPETCVVYGMPKEIASNNLHNYQLPIDKIGEKIVEISIEKD
ncbi:two-component system, chemotaxis family, response regulator CheB [Thermotomaculum hydrothermale]|uniref:protein-glutamate methylesterase n=1 Tax=Thermotomaculum hydrothermale TaxID=981385 RepID=A0A7R6PLA3_9BACT|nr:chemotaxis-specific protein-glutamate methyltransferase CheB [Thermotomaculum hydrothermale]BBB32197.1 two-component system, chemotaxis family, response regulator CheB [Thermotomaculum hydrothermale]